MVDALSGEAKLIIGVGVTLFLLICAIGAFALYIFIIMKGAVKPSAAAATANIVEWGPTVGVELTATNRVAVRTEKENPLSLISKN